MPKVFADVTIVPIGTGNTSISSYVAASEMLLKEFPDIQYKINPMSTTLDGEMDRVLELTQTHARSTLQPRRSSRIHGYPH